MFKDGARVLRPDRLHDAENFFHKYGGASSSDASSPLFAPTFPSPPEPLTCPTGDSSSGTPPGQPSGWSA
jgi:hypothetical protein